MQKENEVLSFRAFVYPEEGRFVVHCLELDIIGAGNTVQGAVESLIKIIEKQLQSCAENNAQLSCDEVKKKINGRRIWGKVLLAMTARPANRNVLCFITKTSRGIDVELPSRFPER